MDAATAFRRLRAHWFRCHLRVDEPEREWESVSQAAARELSNAALKRLYDADTEAILAGKTRQIAPRCSKDLGPKA